VTKDSRRIEAKVTEVNVNDVKYKMFTNQDGPTYTLLKSDIASILYQNGNVDTFVGATSPAPASASSKAQLMYKNGVWQDGVRLQPFKVKMVMEDNHEALYAYKNGQTLGMIGIILSGGGGALIGINLGIAMADGFPEPALWIVGGSSIAAGLVLAFIGDSKIKNSVSIYNSKLKSYAEVPYQINFGFTQTGVGLTMRF